jgi:hypothetical protein
MQARFWYPAVTVVAITLSSAAVSAQTAKTPSAQADSTSIVSLTHPANATSIPATANAATLKPQTDLAKVEADRMLERMLNHDAGNLTVQHGPGRTEILDVGEGFMMVSIAVRNTDGTRSIVCVDNYRAARHALDTPSGPAVQ